MHPFAMSAPLFVMLGGIVLRADNVRYLATDDKDDTRLLVVFTDSTGVKQKRS